MPWDKGNPQKFYQDYRELLYDQTRFIRGNLFSFSRPMHYAMSL